MRRTAITKTNCPNQLGLFDFQSARVLAPQMLDSKSLKALETIKEVTLDQLSRIVHILNKMDKPKYLGAKWYYIRQDYQLVSRKPTECAITTLREFISDSRENDLKNAQSLERCLNVVEMMFKLENEVKVYGILGYESKVQFMQKQREESPQHYAADLLSIYRVN